MCVNYHVQNDTGSGLLVVLVAFPIGGFSRLAVGIGQVGILVVYLCSEVERAEFLPGSKIPDGVSTRKVEMESTHSVPM